MHSVYECQGDKWRSVKMWKGKGRIFL